MGQQALTKQPIITNNQLSLTTNYQTERRDQDEKESIHRKKKEREEKRHDCGHGLHGAVYGYLRRKGGGGNDRFQHGTWEPSVLFRVLP
jgi:hypothetical protein